MNQTSPGSLPGNLFFLTLSGSQPPLNMSGFGMLVTKFRFCIKTTRMIRLLCNASYHMTIRDGFVGKTVQHFLLKFCASIDATNSTLSARGLLSNL